MSNHARRQTPLQLVERSQGLFHKMEQELQEGYLEVEITGLTLHRLVATYFLLTRNAWHSTLANVRSLLRPTPAL